MMGMCHGMMSHGMEHMSEGGTMECPMMQGTKGGGHEMHHGHGHPPAGGADEDGDGSR
jgi:hypothetical protein